MWSKETANYTFYINLYGREVILRCFRSSYSNNCDKLKFDLFRSCIQYNNSLSIAVVTENYSGSHSQKIGIL